MQGRLSLYEINVKCFCVDPLIQAEVDSWRANLANYSSQHVGQTLVYLNGTFEECRFRECNLGNLICDAMVSEQVFNVRCIFHVQ